MDPVAAEMLARFARATREHALLIVDPGGTVLWWAEGSERLFGWSAADMAGQPLDRIFTPEDLERGVPAQERDIAARDGESGDDRWQLRKDGTTFWASGVMTAAYGAGGKVDAFVKILRDRTDLREQLEAYRNRATSLEEAGRRKDAFLSTLSHELRNPLAPLATASQIIRASGPLSPDVEYALKVIDRQTGLLRHLVDDLLDLTRIGAGKVNMQPERCDLRDIIRRAAEDTRALVQSRGHSLHVIGLATPLMVDADPQRLLQVFVNLLTNAAKYTPEGGRIWVTVTVEGDEAVVRIEDTGIGIAPEMLPRIFDLFTQVEAARSLSQGGLGIGLALVKDLVTMHGGTVQVRSEGQGKGSEFAVRLPLKAG